MDGLEDTVGVPARWFQSSDFAVRRLDDRLHCRCCSAPNNSVRAISRCLRRRSCHHDAPDVTGPSNAKELRSEGDGENRGDGQGHEHRDPRKGPRSQVRRPWLRHRDHGRGSGGHAPTGSSRRPLATATGAGGGPAEIRGRSSITLWPNLIRSSTVMPVESVPGSLLIVDPFVEPRSTSLNGRTRR